MWHGTYRSLPLSRLLLPLMLLMPLLLLLLHHHKLLPLQRILMLLTAKPLPLHV